LSAEVSSRTPAATRGSGHVRSRPSQHTQSTQATRVTPSSDVEEQGHMTQPGEASATRSSEATRITVAVDSILADGRALLADEGVLDSVWVDDLAAVVIDALMSSRSDQVSALELALSTFDAELRARGDQPEPVVAQVGLLRRVAQLGAQSLTPREVARTIEPNSHAARLLMLLAASNEEMFSDALAEELELHPTQLSRIFKSLTSHGLVQRIKYGRRASWSLTPAGQIAANQVRERDVQPAPQDLVVAATPEEFEDAVHRSVDALEIDAPNEGAWYLRAVLDRMTGDEIFGSEHMPLLVFPKSSVCDAYVRSDVARTFTRLLGSGRFPDERAEERSTNDSDERQPGTAAFDSSDCAGVS
jgi:DNA-binding MarR family transcriptional regulator